jgi:hypothetical protein
MSMTTKQLNRRRFRRSSGKAIKATKVSSPKKAKGQLEFHYAFKSGKLAAAETPAGSKARFRLLAYTGVPVELDGWLFPVIVDLDGVRFAKSPTPVLFDHETTRRAGHTVSQRVIPAGQSVTFQGETIKGPAIVANCVASSSMAIAEGFIADAKEGFPFEVSIGAKSLNKVFVPEGQKVSVNGKNWKGPLYVSLQTVIRELSVTVLGADGSTRAQVAAKLKSLALEKDTMTFADFVKSLGLSFKDMNAKQKKAVKARYEEHNELEELRATVATMNGPGDEEEEEDEDDDPTPRRTVKANQKKGKKPARRQAVDDDEEDDDATPGLSLSDTRNLLAQEHERATEIDEICAKFIDVSEVEIPVKGGKSLKLSRGKFKAYAIRENLSPEKAEVYLLRASRHSDEGPGIHAKTKDIDPQALECSILKYFSNIPMRAKNQRTGMEYGVETLYSSEVLEASEDKKYNFGGSFRELCRMQIEAAGQHCSAAQNSREYLAATFRAMDQIKATGFSTLNLTVVLENVLNKEALSAFQAVETVWQFITSKRPVNDFKPHALYRLDIEGSFKKVAADGQLKHVSMTDSKKTIQAETYGAMIALDYKTLRNDDMGIILNKARSIGTLGAQRVEEAVFVLLLSNPGSFFHANNSNLLTGGTSVLGIGGMDLARALYRGQVVNGKPITNSPRILLVPTTLETTAADLYNEANYAVGGGNTSTGLITTRNPHKGLFRPYVSPWLNNTNIRDQDGAALSGQSATAWYLLGDPDAPQGSAIQIAFLDNRQVPYFDQDDTDFTVPRGLQFRSYFDFGVAMHFPQMAVKSAGA